MFRWISYTQAHIPGNQSFQLGRHESLADARQTFLKFCHDSGYDASSMSLYAYSDEAWAQAEDFRDIGCPFDYPVRRIIRGERNGVVMEKC